MTCSKYRTVFAITVLFSFVFSSCLTPSKVDRWIDKKYGGQAEVKPRKSDYLIMQPVVKSGSVIANTKKRKTKLVPALFYWKWEYGTFSTLNQSIPASTINANLLSMVNAKGLKQKLNGQHMELTIEKAPTQFHLIDKGWLVFAVLFYFSKDDIFVHPEAQDLVVSYRLLKDNAEVKTGTITVTDRNKDIHVKFMKSVKKTFWNYLDHYQSNLHAMTKELAEKLVAEVS